MPAAQVSSVMLDLDGVTLLEVKRPSGKWWALIRPGNYQGGGKYRLAIFKTKVGFQVWFDNAPASGYLDSLAEAVQELKLLDAEERLVPSERQQAWTRKKLMKVGSWTQWGDED